MFDVAHCSAPVSCQVLPDRGKGVGVQLAVKGQVNPQHHNRFAVSSHNRIQFNDLPPEVRPYKPDQGLKAELKASSAKGFDMAIGQVRQLFCSRFCALFDGVLQATDFRKLAHVTVNPNR